jgi:peptidoglycan/xylan/chitin deacetylase (PgdA/CDA1 family)
MIKKIYKDKNFTRLFLISFFVLASHYLCCSAGAANGTALAKPTNWKNLSGYFAPILTFHHVAFVPANIDKVGRGLYVNPVYFEQVLIELKKNNYQTVFASEIESYLAKGQRPPRNWVALTFDDGYEDFYTNVLPLLKKYNTKASLYIITSRFSGDYLTRDQVKEIDQTNLVEIGSHTVSHPQLAWLSPVKQQRELKESKADLERLLKKNILSICYPSGSYNQETEMLAKQVGYQYGFTYNHRPWRDTKDAFSIDRVSIWQGMDVIKFLDNLDKRAE